MQMSPHLSFNGQCEAAFKQYARCLGGQVGQLFPYGESPMAAEVPADWKNKVMHGSVTIGDQMLMGADVTPDRYEAPKGITLSIQIANVAEAERIFRDLAEGGTIVMPLEQTFWAARFGVLVDRFGIPWQINCEQAAQGTIGQGT
jgi:PhnB protein